MRMYDKESSVKQRLKENVRDESVFNDLKDIAEFVLRQHGFCRNSLEYDELSIMIAEDVWMSFIDGEPIDHIFGWIDRRLPMYGRKYYTSQSFIQLDDILLDLSQKPHWMKEYSLVINKIYLEEIYRVAEEVIHKHSRFKSEKSNRNLMISLLLSIIRDEETYFHLTDEEKPIIHLLMISFYQNILRHGIDIREED